MMYFGSLADCRSVQEAFDYAKGLPFWPSFPAPMTSAEQAKYNSWMAATPAERVTLQGTGQYSGWTLHESDVYPVDPPGFGYFISVPDDLQTVVIPGCLNSFNRTLSVGQLTALLAASAAAQESLPAQWVPEEEE